ncbi:Eukaryotic translation initiation factor 3 subunit A, partial [Ophiophagus hannah]
MSSRKNRESPQSKNQASPTEKTSELPLDKTLRVASRGGLLGVCRDSVQLREPPNPTSDCPGHPASPSQESPRRPFWMQVGAGCMWRLGEGENQASWKFEKDGNGPISGFQRASGARGGHFRPPRGLKKASGVRGGQKSLPTMPMPILQPGRQPLAKIWSVPVMYPLIEGGQGGWGEERVWKEDKRKEKRKGRKDGVKKGKKGGRGEKMKEKRKDGVKKGREG